MSSIMSTLRTVVRIEGRSALRASLLACLLSSAACPGSLPDPAAFLDPDGGREAGSVDGPSGAAEASAACPDIPTLLAQTCGAVGCHDDMTRAEALDLKSAGVASRLVGVHASEGAGLLIDPASPTTSVLYTKLLPTPPFGARMPTPTPLDEATIQCVLAWVTSEAATVPAADGGTTAMGDASPGLDAAGDEGGSTVFSTVRVAAGQTSAVADAQKNMWSADVGFTGGTAAVQTPATAITGTDSAALYNGQRYGNPGFSYQFTVPNGAYTVTLKFAETYVTGPNLRVFSIAINSTTVEPSFDIYAAAGAMNAAVDRSYPVTVTAATIQIDFAAGAVQYPKVDAIEIGQGDGGM